MSVTFLSANGWRCEPCFHQGKLYTSHDHDKSLLGEADRCQGCGEVICDRHQRPAQAEPHDGGWDFHNMIPRVTVTEV
jgi:hypothetical protein